MWLILLLVACVILISWISSRPSDTVNSSQTNDSNLNSHSYENNIEIVANSNGRRVYPDVQKPTYYERMRQKHAATIDGHYYLNAEIERLYSAARLVRARYDSPEMLHIVELCQKDIVTYAEKYMEYLNEFKYPIAKREYLFPSFTRLAIIYENQKDYQSALDVCDHAINLGYTAEGGKTDVFYRKDRLIRKLGIDMPDALSVFVPDKDSDDKRSD